MNIKIETERDKIMFRLRIMKKSIVVSLCIFLIANSGCTNHQDINETQTMENFTIESETSGMVENKIELVEEETEIPVETTRDSDEQLKKVYEISEMDEDYQLVVYYVNKNNSKHVSYAELYFENSLIQKINFEEYNAKERQQLLSKEEVGLYEYPLEISDNLELIEWKDYNFDGNMDFSITQELFTTNYSEFIFLWNAKTKTFEFMMRELQVSNYSEEESKNIVFDVDGGMYQKSEYYGIDENGKMKLEKIRCIFWDADNLPFDTIEWIYVETEGSVKAKELVSNEKMWNNYDIATEWSAKAEKMISEWNKDTGIEKGYFTVSWNGEFQFSYSKEDLLSIK